MGAINKPINGNNQAAKGIAPQLLMACVAVVCCVNGIVKSSNKAMATTHTTKNTNQSTLLKIKPADSRPTANDAAKMLVI